MKIKRTILGVSFAVLLATTAIVWSQRQAIYDWAVLRNYQPPAHIAQLADQTTMTEKTRHLFYVQRPSLEDKTSFRSACPFGEQTIVLGCYVNTGRIYLLQVDDSRLAGVEQVTAAHELLHAAYERMGDKEKQRVNTLLTTAYTQVKDERIRSTIEQYRANNADINNELHSILGTEVAQLTPELETHYQKYFANRQTIVAFSEKYEQTFTDRKNQVAQYDTQLDDLKKQIEENQHNLELENQALLGERSRLDNLLNTKQYEAYNAAVPVFNAKIRSYNNTVNETRSLIDRYNDILAKRNAIALETQELVKAIDSRPNAQPEE